MRYEGVRMSAHLTYLVPKCLIFHSTTSAHRKYLPTELFATENLQVSCEYPLLVQFSSQNIEWCQGRTDMGKEER